MFRSFTRQGGVGEQFGDLRAGLPIDQGNLETEH
jgi:hypothetical protein